MRSLAGLVGMYVATIMHVSSRKCYILGIGRPVVVVPEVTFIDVFERGDINTIVEETGPSGKYHFLVCALLRTKTSL